MTTTLDLPAQPPAGPPTRPAAPPTGEDPTRSPLGRGLLWVGVGLGVVALVWGALQVADVAMTRVDRSTATYGTAPVVELIADGRVEVSAAGVGEDVTVERIARSGLVSPAYEVSEDRDRLVVRHECDAWFGICSGALSVQVPEGAEVVVTTSDGDVVAQGVVGSLDVRTSNGRVEAEDVQGDARLHSSNGDVLATRVTGLVDARTSNGRIEAYDVGGDLDAVTSNGDVEVDDVDGDARVRSANGRLEVAAVDGDVEAVSSNGDVTVHGDDSPVALTISTSNGRQTVEAPTDPSASRVVVIRTWNGNVSYLGPR